MKLGILIALFSFQAFAASPAQKSITCKLTEYDMTPETPTVVEEIQKESASSSIGLLSLKSGAYAMVTSNPWHSGLEIKYGIGVSESFSVSGTSSDISRLAQPDGLSEVAQLSFTAAERTMHSVFLTCRGNK